MCQWKIDLPECAVETDEASIKLCNIDGGMTRAAATTHGSPTPNKNSRKHAPSGLRALELPVCALVIGRLCAARNGAVHRTGSTFDLQPVNIAAFFF